MREKHMEFSMNKGDRLYNGIILPKEWPPRIQLRESQEPMSVPYLESPPNVIPIDVGRQLFIDDFLIETTTLKRRFYQAQKYENNPVLKPETKLEMNEGECPVACPFNDGVWYDPTDQLFKMWYHAGWFDGTGYAISEDGFHWERPDLDIVKGTNRIMAPRPGFRRDGACVWLDNEAHNPNQRFKMFQFFRSPDWEGGEVYTSPDGIHWGELARTETRGDNTSFFYNPFRKKWVFSIRTWQERGRVRAYREHSNFFKAAKWNKDEPVFWSRTDKLDPMDTEIGDESQLYDLNAVAYESIMLGLFAIYHGPSNDVCARKGIPKINELIIGFSRDGFHFDRPERRVFIAATRRKGSWDRAYIHASGGVCLIVGDKLYFYYGAWSGESPRLKGSMVGSHPQANAMYAGGSTGIAFLRRDGFASMDADKEEGFLITRPVTFNGKYMFVNVNTSEGELLVEVLTEQGELIKPFSLSNCIPMRVNKTLQLVIWKGVDDLSTLTGKTVKIKFHLTNNSKLYSFWVSPERSGVSHGYVAAGGPGFTDTTDT